MGNQHRCGSYQIVILGFIAWYWYTEFRLQREQNSLTHCQGGKCESFRAIPKCIHWIKDHSTHGLSVIIIIIVTAPSTSNYIFGISFMMYPNKSPRHRSGYYFLALSSGRDTKFNPLSVSVQCCESDPSVCVNVELEMGRLWIFCTIFALSANVTMGSWVGRGRTRKREREWHLSWPSSLNLRNRFPCSIGWIHNRMHSIGSNGSHLDGNPQIRHSHSQEYF